jgi:hypothetical protein
VAAPRVPRRELAAAALSLACWRAFGVAREVVRSYRGAGGDDTAIQACDLGQPMMTGLDWVAFQVERAVGRRPAAPAEVERAHELVPGLLAVIPRHAAVALRSGSILRM